MGRVGYWPSRSRYHHSRERGWKGLSRGKQLAILAGVAFFGTLIVWLCVGVLYQEEKVGTVVAAKWAWHINTERWDKVSYQNRYTKQSGAYNVSVNYWDDDTTYNYDVDEWVHHQTFSKVGHDKKPLPPEYVLPSPRTAAQAQKQCQVGPQTQVFSVLIDCEDGKGRLWETTENNWRRWKKNDNVIVTINGFGNVQHLVRLRLEK